ncbi:hypothetical protein TRAPUB_8789 [Trametes pubescens]|uniref:F-box domain-containing protein n=1 Tax=Trametes pubescens TaxID=154538 RepID=A0A1M2W803_TRAPU|nr:hypothetical protein TRAPUB_8789 [Trametes pubescens]
MSSASGIDRSALHRLPPQVLEQICRELLHIQAWHVGRGTLAALASTAQIFHEPALNALWHTIPDIAVLFYTLPEDAYKKTPFKAGNRWLKGYQLNHNTNKLLGPMAQNFNGIPETSQFERFIVYARRVRRIDHQVAISTRVENHSAVPSAYDTLAKILRPRVPLPNLKEVHYNCRQTTSPMQLLRFLPVLFSPQLRVLHIYHHDPLSIETRIPPALTAKDEKGFARMWNKLKDTAPNLQELSMVIQPFECSSTVVAAVSTAVTRLENLVSLVLRNKTCTLTPAALASLARFPHLRCLRVHVGASFRTLELASLVATGDAAAATFLALRVLEITAPTLALPTELLRFFESPYLAALTVTAIARVLRCEVRPFFFAITRMRAREHLRELSVWAEKVRPTAASTDGIRRLPAPIDKETLAPLLLLSGMAELSLHLCCRYDIDDELLDLLARSWPKLESLVFRPTRPADWGLREIPEPPHASGPAPDTGEGGAPRGPRPAANGALVMLDGDPAKTWPKPRATLFGLLAFAQHCPHMCGITVELDADLSRVPPSRLEACTRLGAPHAAFKSLYVGLSPVEDPYAVAAFLSDSFPEIDDLEDDWRNLKEYEGDALKFGERWEAVYELIPKFAAVRSQERKWKQRAAASKG